MLIKLLPYVAKQLKKYWIKGGLTMANLEVKLVKSLIGSKKDQIATASSLGLRKIGDKATQPDNPQTQGKIKKISHLIEVTKA